MKKVYRIKNLECAHCAHKMEKAIQKLDGVENASVNFLMQKITIETSEENIAELGEQIAKICKKIESNCEVVL